MAGSTAADLKKISDTIGIDLDALREKYSGVNTEPKAAVEDQEKVRAAQEAFKKLDKYMACTECGGTGIVKSIYNFISMESNCTHCDGDGLLSKEVESIVKEKQGESEADNATEEVEVDKKDEE